MIARQLAMCMHSLCMLYESFRMPDEASPAALIFQRSGGHRSRDGLSRGSYNCDCCNLESQVGEDNGQREGDNGAPFHTSAKG